MNTINIRIKISDQALANLKRLAALNRVSPSEIIRRAIEEPTPQVTPALPATTPTRTGTQTGIINVDDRSGMYTGENAGRCGSKDRDRPTAQKARHQ